MRKPQSETKQVLSINSDKKFRQAEYGGRKTRVLWRPRRKSVNQVSGLSSKELCESRREGER